MSGKPPTARVTFRLFRLFWPFWQFCAVAHFRRFAVAIIRALSTAGTANPGAFAKGHMVMDATAMSPP